MAMWLSGFVLLFCCHFAAAASGPDSCPLAKSSDHCKRAAQSDQATVVPHASDTLGCCQILPAIFDKARKVEKTKKPAAVVAKAEKVRNPMVGPASSGVLIPRYSPRLIDQHGIHLRNRVFRI